MPKLRKIRSRAKAMVGRLAEKISVRRTRRAYEKATRVLERRIGSLPRHEVIIAPRREIALFSGGLPLTKAIRENKIREFEERMTRSRLPGLLGASLSKSEITRALEGYLKKGKNREVKDLANKLLEKVKTAKSENIILVGSSPLTSKRAIMEQIGHEIGHLKLNEIAGKRIDTSTPENAKLHEGFATLFGVATARPGLISRIKNPTQLRSVLTKMGYPEMYARGAENWWKSLDRKERDILPSLVKTAIKKARKR